MIKFCDLRPSERNIIFTFQPFLALFSSSLSFDPKYGLIRLHIGFPRVIGPIGFRRLPQGGVLCFSTFQPCQLDWSASERGITKSNSTKAEVDSSSNSTMPTAYRTEWSKLSQEVREVRHITRWGNAPPKMKCATASNWQRSIVLPRDSRTTLKPKATIKSRKNESALRPASRIATVLDENTE